MATLPLAYDFTGTNGAAWDATLILSSVNPTAGGGTQIQGDTGQLTTGSTGGYSGNDRVARTFNIGNTTTDIDILFDFQIVGEVYPTFFFRQSANTDPTNPGGYSVKFASANTNWVIAKATNYTVTELANAGSASAANTWYSMRIQAVGTTLRARYWVQGGAEPGTWNIGSVTDSTYTAGWAGWSVAGGGAAAGQVMNFDNLNVTVPSSGAGSGALGLSGAGTLALSGSGAAAASSGAGTLALSSTGTLALGGSAQVAPAGTYTFVGPVLLDWQPFRRYPPTRLFHATPYGQTVWKDAQGVWHTQYAPTLDQLNGALEVFAGGRVYTVTGAQATELQLAGFGAGLNPPYPLAVVGTARVGASFVAPNP